MDSTAHSKQRQGMERPPHRIPTDLLSEILLRLPATSVARFRYACKFWRSITLDPYFIDSHLQHAPKSILIYKWQWDRQRQRITILDSNWGPKPSLTRPIPQVLSLPSLITSCNGLLCFHYKDSTPRIELFNPATQESLTLPAPAMGIQPYYATVHFGFHPRSKEYKSINFFAKSMEIMACQVYTLGTSSWREICHLDYRPLPLQCSTTVKGSIYLRVTRLTEKVVPDIVSFDLQDERFTSVSLPNFEVSYHNNKYQRGDLVELQGSVCISVFVDLFPESSDVAMDIWMLDDDHGTQHDWTRKYSIINGTYWLTIDPQPLLIHKEKILLKLCDHKENVLSNPDSESFKQSNVTMLRYHHLKSGEKEVQWEDNAWFFTFVHVESLVPLRDPRSPPRRDGDSLAPELEQISLAV